MRDRSRQKGSLARLRGYPGGEVNTGTRRLNPEPRKRQVELRGVRRPKFGRRGPKDMWRIVVHSLTQQLEPICTQSRG